MKGEWKRRTKIKGLLNLHNKAKVTKNKTKTLLSLLLSLIVCHHNIYASSTVYPAKNIDSHELSFFESYNLKPFIALDTQLRDQTFKAGFGHLLLENVYPQLKLSLGVNINNSFDFEIGYLNSFKKESSALLREDNFVLGNQTFSYLERHSASFGIKGFQALLTRYFAPKYRHLERTQILVFIGASALKPAGTHMLLEEAFSVVSPLVPTGLPEDKLVTKWTWVPSIGVGACQNFNSNTFLKVRFEYEFTRVARKLIDKTPDLITYSAKLKNAMIVSVGIGCFF